MAYTYQVSYGLSATGPWTSAGTTTATTDTISGLQPSTNYYFQVIAVDSVTGLQSAPVVSGPYQTAAPAPPPPAPPPAQVESLAGTTVTTTGVTIYASQTLNTASTGPFNTWSLATATTSGATNYQINYNGTLDPVTTDVTTIYYINHTFWQFGSGNWYFWNCSGSQAISSDWSFSSVGSPVPNISLSGTNVATGAPSGTVVGTVSITTVIGTSSGTTSVSAYSGGVLSIGGTNASSFKLVGTSLETNAALTLSSYNITLILTQSGITLASTPFTITVGVSYAFNRPAAIPSNWVVVMFDDFTTTGTTLTQPSGLASITTNGSNTTGYNWYQAGGEPTVYNVFPTATAATLSTYVSGAANNGGGSNASPNGGIWNLVSGNSANQVGFLSSGVNNPNPPIGATGSWQYAYFEAYIQFNNPGQTSNNWAGWWTESTGQPNSSYTEVDFMETIYGGTVHNWPSNTQTNVYFPSFGGGSWHVDSNWHTYGVYWQNTGTNTGLITYYIDNTQIGSSVTTGTGSTYAPSLIGSYGLYMIIGPGTTSAAQLNVDWIRVWQA